jgi:glycosyltransferase involved in cell wall biosynthesis
MRLVYRFSGPITNKVIHSQVAGMLGALAAQGVDVDLLAWCGAGHALRNRAAYAKAEQELSALAAGGVHWHLTLDRLPRLDAWLKTREMRRSLPGSAEPTVIQTRSLDMGAHLARLRLARPELRFVYEMRGDPLAELAYTLQEEREREQRQSALRRQLQGILPAADLVTCVSQVLAERMQQQFDLSPERLHVVPCTADEGRFRPDADKRATRRRELRLPADAHLLLYSGSLTKGWDQPAEVKAFLARELQRHSFLHALLLSPDAEVAAELQRSLPACRVHHRSLSHGEMQDWLVAADSALLLREAHPLNEVASPTKVAEILLCGVPLLLSKGVGDYSQWVEAEGAGRLVEAGASREINWRSLEKLDAAKIRAAALLHVGRHDHARCLKARLEALFSS